MSEPTYDSDLTAVERALAGLAPSAGTFNRDALLFAAGRRSARRGWAWPAVAGGSALAAAALAAVLFFRPAPPPTVVTVYVEVPQPPREEPSRPGDSIAAEAAPPAPPASPLRPEPDYLTLRRQVERWGDAGLPAAPPTAADQASPPADDGLDLPPGTRVDPWLPRRKADPNPGGPL